MLRHYFQIMNKEATTDHWKTFSFSEIVHKRNSSVRMTNDGFLYAVDLVMAVTGHSRDQAEFALQWLPRSKSTTIKLIDSPTIDGITSKIITFENRLN